MFAGPLDGSKAAHDGQDIRFLTASVVVVIGCGAPVPAGQTELRPAGAARGIWMLGPHDATWLVATYHSCSMNAA